MIINWHLGRSHFPFRPPSTMASQKGHDKKGQKGIKGDKKGQKGTKRDKIFIKTLKMPILMAKLVGKGTKWDIKNQKF